MIPKSVQRFSEKIMLKQKLERDDDSTKSHPALARITQPPPTARIAIDPRTMLRTPPKQSE
jgi:hypothetical protein